MFAAVYGESATHSWLREGVTDMDPYSLFVARSTAMGWLTPASENAAGGFWGMNGAGRDPDSDSELGSRIAWFQVSLTEPESPVRPLPLQPFFSCIDDVLRRMVDFGLGAVQATFPVPGVVPSKSVVAALIEAGGWFADPRAEPAVRVRVTLDGEPEIGSSAADLLRWLGDVRQSVFADPSMAELTSHRITLHGTLAEWSLPALGWLAAFLADACARAGCGAGGPVRFTAVRFA